jgi:hypothetical protein
MLAMTSSWQGLARSTEGYILFDSGQGGQQRYGPDWLTPTYCVAANLPIEQPL